MEVEVSRNPESSQFYINLEAPHFTQYYSQISLMGNSSEENVPLYI